MDEFLSTHVNRLDSKGRVSIPAAFRQVLARESRDHLFCSPSLDLEAVDAGGDKLHQEIHAHLESYEAFSEEREVLSTVLLGDSENLKIDKDGRVVLSETLKDHTGITDSVVFVGHGFKFQLWQPERYEAYRRDVSKRAQEMRRARAARKREQGGEGGSQ